MSRRNPRTWTTKDGRVLKIREMSTAHLRNTIRMLEANGCVSVSTLEAYFCDGPSGDMASMLFDQEQREVFEAPVSRHLDALRDELAGREGAEEA